MLQNSAVKQIPCHKSCLTKAASYSIKGVFLFLSPTPCKTEQSPVCTLTCRPNGIEHIEFNYTVRHIFSNRNIVEAEQWNVHWCVFLLSCKLACSWNIWMSYFCILVIYPGRSWKLDDSSHFFFFMYLMGTRRHLADTPKLSYWNSAALVNLQYALFLSR